MISWTISMSQQKAMHVCRYVWQVSTRGLHMEGEGFQSQPIYSS